MSVWYTSDIHFGHRKIAEIRGFVSPDGSANVAEHDQTIIDNWYDVVHTDDIVWVLGDLSVSKPDKALSYLKAMPGRKHLIAGNHDECHSLHREAHKWQRKYLEAFESVQTFARRKSDGVEFLLSHFPYTMDHTADVRYAQYRLRDEGMWLVHGHTHSEVVQTSAREIHVGLDAHNLQLVNERDIVDLIKYEEKNR